MDEFERAWENFRSERKLMFGGHTDPDFRGDHTCSAAFVIPVDISRFVGEISPLREVLGAFPFVSLHPDYFMHISLVLAGFVDDTDPKAEEMTSDSLDILTSRARQSLSGFEPFHLTLKNLGAFPSAAYVEAHDEEAHDENGRVDTLRDALLLGCGLEGKPGPPHLTLAYFRAEDGTMVPDELLREIGRYRDYPVGSFVVEEVHLTVLDLCEEYARPKVFSRLRLGPGGG